MAGQADELLKGIIRKAANKNAALRDEAVKMGILEDTQDDDVDWQDYASRRVFLNKLGNGEINPPAERFEKASDETLRDWARGDYPLVLPSALSTVMCVLSARITAAVKDSPPKALRTFGELITTNADRPGPLAALMPACVTLGGKSKLRKNDPKITWQQLVEKVEGINDATLNMAFQELVRQRDAAKAEKARQTREANKAAGIVAHDKFIDALESGDLEKVEAYELAKFDQKRFDRVKGAWFQARPGVQLLMLKCKPELWTPHTLTLARAIMAKDTGRRPNGVCLTLDRLHWAQLSEDERLDALDHMFDNEIRLEPWPTIEETAALAVALKLMDTDRDYLCENLQTWVALRKIAVMGGKERDWASVGWQSVQLEPFERALGTTGKMLHMSLEHTTPTNMLTVLVALPAEQRGVAAELVMRFYVWRAGAGRIFAKPEVKK